MGNDGNLITLVIHTEDRALKLKEVLEFHDIAVVLDDVQVDDLPLQVAPKKVRIPVSSLALGLKILESGEANGTPLSLMKMTGMGSSLLIPVDFSPASMLAVKAGFFLAEKFDVEPIVLHAYLAPHFATPAEPFARVFDDNESDSSVVEAEDLYKIASSQLSKFKSQVVKAQAEGSIPDIRFSTTLLEGVPEQVIQDYCKQNHPLMVVMSTRGKDKKESDLVGSVTAEVIDSCRIPVFAVPDNYTPCGVDKFKRIAMFCTFTGFDVVALRGLMHTFDYPSTDFYLMPVSDRLIRDVRRKSDQLCDYLTQILPTANFHSVRPDGTKFDDCVKNLLADKDIQLIIVPNKKSSALSRFFRPALAHRILFERDIPLLVLPV